MSPPPVLRVRRGERRPRLNRIENRFETAPFIVHTNITYGQQPYAVVSVFHVYLRTPRHVFSRGNGVKAHVIKIHVRLESVCVFDVKTRSTLNFIFKTFFFAQIISAYSRSYVFDVYDTAVTAIVLEKKNISVKSETVNHIHKQKRARNECMCLAPMMANQFPIHVFATV